jgi:hypothetical protein
MISTNHFIDITVTRVRGISKLRRESIVLQNNSNLILPLHVVLEHDSPANVTPHEHS